MADEPIYLPPKLRDGQSCVVHAMDVRTSGIRELYRTQDILLKSPNWLASGHLPLHGESHLWRLSPDAARIVRVDSQSACPKSTTTVAKFNGGQRTISVNAGRRTEVNSHSSPIRSRMKPAGRAF